MKERKPGDLNTGDCFHELFCTTLGTQDAYVHKCALLEVMGIAESFTRTSNGLTRVFPVPPNAMSVSKRILVS